MPVAASIELGDVRTADACRGFEKHEAPVATADVFAVRDAAHEAKRRQHALVEREQFGAFRRCRAASKRVVKTPPACETSNGGVPYLLGTAAQHLALVDDRVDVVHVAGDVLLEQKVRPLVAQRFGDLPHFVFAH